MALWYSVMDAGRLHTAAEQRQIGGAGMVAMLGLGILSSVDGSQWTEQGKRWTGKPGGGKSIEATWRAGK
jgi:hypothetical protein